MKAIIENYRQNISEEDLWANLEYFIKAIMPTAEEAGVKMAIHPDDPPYGIFGLPRIITGQEAVERFLNPSVIDIKTAMIVAFIGLVVNVITGVILMQGDKNNINLKSAFVHMLSDALSSVAIIIGYIVIYFTSWYFIDILLALLVAAVIGKWAMGILKSSVNTLMESSPLNLKEVQNFIEQHNEVLELHDIHIWEITQDMYNMTAHVKIKKSSLENYEQLLYEINQELKQKYKIVHTTFQFEW